MPSPANAQPMHQRKNGKGMYAHRGGHGGDIESRGGGRSARETNAGIMEQQNNERISELSEQVARLKGLTIDIGNEVREQNSLLDSMQDGFVSTQDMLQGSLRRIGTMLESGGAKHMLMMVGFSVFVMCFLWWLMGHRGQHGV
ncbi:Blocked early in transport 1 homolog [Seminavis robusta]|uniref:Blocked early in transport 1 homolog n=1 Tax=Seminavis robusta TaxID=568900 RepID=A0A9N8DUE7_9STRA|nr:Blocked early in transport 1 homolog [Seminavis robusta]|eukprot:Sro358_g125860.1 Blocked early in transport 1 homolog (S (143) ;mRNA; f:30866-31294